MRERATRHCGRRHGREIDAIVGAELQSGALVNVFPDYHVTATGFSTAAWILYPTRNYVPLKVRAFTDFLKEEFCERPPWLRPTEPRSI